MRSGLEGETIKLYALPRNGGSRNHAALDVQHYVVFPVARKKILAMLRHDDLDLILTT